MQEQRRTIQAIGLGFIASLFLSSTFIINSLLAHTTGHWTWTAALRSIFLIPILGIILLCSKQLKPMLQAIQQMPGLFIQWGILSFGALYTLLALASLFVPGWLVAATFQINILAGMLLAPFIYNDHRSKIPRRALLLSVLILVGVLIMQFEKLQHVDHIGGVILSFFLVLGGAVAWPLGNRKLMVELEKRGLQLNAVQRVMGLTIGCMPLLLFLCCIGYVQTGWPPIGQSEASFYAALFSGCLGGVGFYKATHLVKHNPVALSTIEATQVFEIFFTLIGEMILNHAGFPGIYGTAGMLVILVGIGMHCYTAVKHKPAISLQLSS
ncbi:putative multidrug resistance efflux transporter [Chitinophaga skermanii]|uniref:Putative multidrug resistance efflux transporter n=1 Tax=Chitinophaga skermanii TaxID=331697 RepID=A0A327QYS1_9BACT|nr:multidrug resistance efflux transporter family protein [Chitinophaga skermanii]RAJ08573.1 putative multidrug resistance efflux transporter [Chitinophaga skermanii]